MKAQFNAGMCFTTGEGVEKDPAAAARWFSRAAEGGHPSAQFNLGMMYSSGEGVGGRDAGMAASWILRAAAQGHVKAQFSIALCYELGDGVDKDSVKAVAWLRRAADKGHADAQLRLGVHYCTGDGVASDAAQGAAWFRRAAESGNAAGQFLLGQCYDAGEGVEKSAAQAVAWFRQAADQGYVEAELNLGICYDTGDGVEKDAALAVVWFQRAAEHGDPTAQFNIGVCHDTGHGGVVKDAEQAAAWFLRAAEGGHVLAEFNVGAKCYNDGHIEESLKWLGRAAGHEYVLARIVLNHARFRAWEIAMGDAAQTSFGTVSLEDVVFEGGLMHAYTTAPRGSFGSVVVGQHSRSGLRMAIKILCSASLDSFARESQLYRMIMKHVNDATRRAAVDNVGFADAAGAPPRLSAWQHVNTTYALGWEANLRRLHPDLPAVGAFLLAMEPLSETLLDRMAKAPQRLIPIAEVVRILHECAVGLAFLATNGIVVRWLCCDVPVPPLLRAYSLNPIHTVARRRQARQHNVSRRGSRRPLRLWVVSADEHPPFVRHGHHASVCRWGVGLS